jgi:hypothetical protein
MLLLLLLGIRFSERSINIPQNLRLNMHPMLVRARMTKHGGGREKPPLCEMQQQKHPP